MGALELVPQSWLSWDFTVLNDGSPIAEIDVSRRNEKGVLAVDGSTYQVFRDGFTGPFILELKGTRLATAKKSAFSRSFAVLYEDKSYTLKAAAALRRTFVLLEGDREIGSIIPAGFFTRRATVSLPDQLPLPIKVFLIWLTVLLWKRDSDAS